MEAKQTQADLFGEVVQRLERIESHLQRIERRMALSLTKDAYTVTEVAERLRRSVWTIRQACNLGRIRAIKAHNGKEWRIPYDELVRLENEGL